MAKATRLMYTQSSKRCSSNEIQNAITCKKLDTDDSTYPNDSQECAHPEVSGFLALEILQQKVLTGEKALTISSTKRMSSMVQLSSSIGC